MSKLVIVESPAKVKTIKKYLSDDFEVTSSKGHIRDLSTKGQFGLGIDVDDDFKPDYKIIKGKTKDVKALKKLAKESDHIYLATDPDREGEAISYHLFDELELKVEDYDRIVFNEITKTAVNEAFNHQRKIDDDLVNSQETRRKLDRIIGFRLSKLVKAKSNGTSAGRVQSVALKLIVDREVEISKFIKEEYWTVKADFKDFEADLVKYKTKKVELKNEKDADKVLDALNSSFNIESVEAKEKKKQAPFPFITSTLQQVASNKLNMSASKTMSVAQKLYEGIDLGTETVGLITYMRTDSTRLSSEFINATFDYIDKKYGKEYKGLVKKSKKAENVQDAHEGIRPSSIDRDPISLKPFLSGDEFKLYKLIYARALASLMAPVKTRNMTVVFDNNDYKFKTTGQTILFDGYLSVYKDYESKKEVILPDFENYKSKVVVANDVLKEQHFTEPKPRYNEAKLIKDLEELGIGRPSTYATIIYNIKNRGYVNVVEKRFIPTEIGTEVTNKLQEYFSHIINVKYTAGLEKDLDEIAVGEKSHLKVLREFYDSFVKALDEAFEKMDKKEVIETGEMCPECGHPLVLRKGRYGEFTACSNFPACKYIKSVLRVETVICDCPNCDGKLIEKKSRRGKIFYACNNYPKCKTAYWDKPTGEKCPKCGEMLTEKKDKIVCSNKECDYEL